MRDCLQHRIAPAVYSKVIQTCNGAYNALEMGLNEVGDENETKFSFNDPNGRVGHGVRFKEALADDLIGKEENTGHENPERSSWIDPKEKVRIPKQVWALISGKVRRASNSREAHI